MRLIHPTHFRMHHKSLTQDTDYEFGASGSIYETPMGDGLFNIQYIEAMRASRVESPPLLSENDSEYRLREWIKRETRQ